MLLGSFFSLKYQYPIPSYLAALVLIVFFFPFPALFLRFLFSFFPSNPQAKAIEKQIQAAKARDEGRGLLPGQAAAAGPTELRREEGQSVLPLRIGLNANAPIVASRGSAGGAGSGNSGAGSNGLKRPRFSAAFRADDEGEEQSGATGARGSNVNDNSSGNGVGKGKGKGKRSVMEVLMDQERAKKAAKLEEDEQAANALAAQIAATNANGGGGGGGNSRQGERKEYWLRAGIVVKVMNKKVGGGKYYKKKGRLRKVVERYVGEVKMLDSGDRLRVDQEDLETVRTGIRQRGDF